MVLGGSEEIEPHVARYENKNNLHVFGTKKIEAIFGGSLILFRLLVEFISANGNMGRMF
jgi:hypothetical protein